MSSPFEIAGPLTESLLMANLAIRGFDIRNPRANGKDFDYPGRYIELLWDNENMKVTNFDDVNQFIKRDYRKGFILLFKKLKNILMKRREAVQYISLLLGGTIVGGNYFLSGCKSNTGMSMTFTPDDVAYLDEIADTILPTTSTPGAKAAKVGQFMTVMVNDCYDEKDQKIFHEGMDKLDDFSKKTYDDSFMKITAAATPRLIGEAGQ